MKQALIILISLLNVGILRSQIKMAHFPEIEKEEVIYTYDSLTNVQHNHKLNNGDYFKHLIGQRITSISSYDFRAYMNVNNSKSISKNNELLKKMDGNTYYIDSVEYDHIYGQSFYMRNENNPMDIVKVTVDNDKLWTIDLSWVSLGYYERIKNLYLNKELVYIHQDEDYDITSNDHSRFMDYNTKRNLTIKIPCNSIWKCTDVLVLPGTLSLGDAYNRVILNIENEQYGKYYIFAYYLVKDVLKKFITLEEYHKHQAVQNKLKTEAKAKAAKAVEEATKRENERRSNIIAKYGETYGNLIIKGQVIIGMTKEQCIEALGNPQRINRTVTSLTTREQWVYVNKYLYFENGILITIQD